ncbi:MAG: PDZ domain-containing protein, partial [Terricaulis sp.]
GEAAGLEEGDVILKLDGEATASVDAIHKLLTRERIGRTVELDVLRNGARRKLKLSVTARPEAKAA